MRGGYEDFQYAQRFAAGFEEKFFVSSETIGGELRDLSSCPAPAASEKSVLGRHDRPARAPALHAPVAELPISSRLACKPPVARRTASLLVPPI